MRNRRPLAVLGGACLLAGIGFVAQPGSAGPVVPSGDLRAVLTGAAEVPGPGDPDGAGTVVVDVNLGLGAMDQVCISSTDAANGAVPITGIGPISASHIHAAAAGVSGGVVVNFNASVDTCVDVDPVLATEIATNPANYYVNVHTADFPAGALRGQLSERPTVVTTTAVTTTGSSIDTGPTSSTVAPSTTSTTAAARPATVAPRFTG